MYLQTDSFKLSQHDGNYPYLLEVFNDSSGGVFAKIGLTKKNIQELHDITSLGLYGLVK